MFFLTLDEGKESVSENCIGKYPLGMETVQNNNSI
jgi:hypothetical protein